MSVKIPKIREIDFNRYSLRDGVLLKKSPGILRSNRGEMKMLNEKHEVEDAKKV